MTACKKVWACTLGLRRMRIDCCRWAYETYGHGMTSMKVVQCTHNLDPWSAPVYRRLHHLLACCGAASFTACSQSWSCLLPGRERGSRSQLFDTQELTARCKTVSLAEIDWAVVMQAWCTKSSSYPLCTSCFTRLFPQPQFYQFKT